MSIRPLHPTHPVLACTEAIGKELDLVAEVDPAYMRTEDQAAALVELSALAARVEELKLRVLASADEVALDSGARSAAAWLAHATRTDAGRALGAARLAEAITGRWSRVGQGLAQGSVNPAQARVLVTSLDDLPADLDPDVVAKAEEYLVGQAAHFAPKQLRVLGAKVLEVVAPEVAEAAERDALERAEAHARRRTSLTFRRRGDGTTEIHARVSDAVAGRLRTYLDAYSSPRQASGDEKVPRDRLLGEAFGALLEHLDPARLPRHGGRATTVVVTIDLDQLRARLGAAGLGTGDLVSAAEAMRLACTADLVPMVLGGRGEVLHQGRAKRLFTDAQRLAMAVRDKTCRAAGCTIPATWSEAHHKHEWALGGRTDLDDGVSLCSWHHHRAHDPAYTVEFHASGEVRFHRRR
ncbi:DUF222 domain-containing protein [Nocardioides sp. GCM10027113]|uniref:HNH endonuclease signature motif containing protein n=3 Tax=unclassified Nocardioides TaxID=2615069 RepID=UPI0036228480